MLGLAFGVRLRRAQSSRSVERSGLTLSGTFHTALKGGAWGRRMGQKRRFLPHARDTEFIEVQYQPLPTGRQAEQILGFDRGKSNG